jgi:hypothetical protein
VRVAALATCLVATVITGPARAGALTRPLAKLGAAEAAVIVRIDVDPLAALTDAAIGRIPRWVRGGVLDLRAGLATAVDADPTTRAGWQALGLDPDRPVLIAISAGTARALALHGEHRPLFEGGTMPAGTERAFAPTWHVRIALPVADRARAHHALARLTSMPTAAGQVELMPAAARIGALATVRVLDLTGVVRLDDHALTIDLFAAPNPPTFAQIGPYLADRSAPRAIDALLATPAGAQLTAPGLDLWIDPRREVEGQLLAGPQPARALVDGACELTCAAVRGPLGPLGVTVSARDLTVTAAIAWEVAAGSPLAAVLGHTVDHGLPRPADLPAAPLIVRSYVETWAPLATLDTSAVPLDLPPPVFAVSAAAWPITAAWSWPARIGGVVDHVTDAAPAAAPALGGLGDFAIAILALGADLDHTTAVAEVAIEPAVEPTLRAAADQLWGPAPHDRWGAGRIRGFARHLAAPSIGLAAPAVGLAVRASAAPYLALPRTSGPPPAGTIAEGRVAPEVLALVHPAAIIAGVLAFTARFDGALRLDLTLTP